MRAVQLKRTFKLYVKCRKIVFSSLHCSKFSGNYPPDNYPPDNYPPDNYPLGQIPPDNYPPQITEFPKHKSTKFTSHKVYKSQKVHKLRGQSHNIYEYKFYKIQVSTKVVHGYGKLWSFGGF